MTSVGDSFAWPFRDPAWFSKIVVQGLIAIIPVVGWIALVGWLVMTIDNYRTGRRELPPAGFHLERGIVLFVVYLIYAIVFAIPGGIITGSGTGQENNGAAVGVSALGELISVGLSLLLAFLAPSIILHTYRSGFNGGFDLSGIWQMATSNLSNSIIAGLLIWVADFIGGIGFFACCIGLLFTLPYGAAIVAGVVTWYDQVMSGPAPAAPTAPAQ